MDISLLRHGDAKKVAENGATKLTDAGRIQIQRITQFLINSGEVFDLIIASPRTRAKESAEIVFEGLSLAQDKYIIDERLNCGDFKMSHLQEIVREYSFCNHILIVGHMPDLGMISSEILGFSGQIDFDKGALLKCNTKFGKPGDGNLIYFIKPELIHLG